uniref:AAA family ATPase n=1 Tax=Gordonia sp. B7-2 TaxID=3420932 RepID=UPI003D8E7F8B
MRLHRLRMRAFGPFAEDTEVDFDALSAEGLFLLHGQTGAGKTTVLDAVAFALYGRVPGARDINRRLYSDHARPEQVPEVELEATIGGRRMRIIRSPEHHRPKKRGQGTRKINASATLHWVDGSGPDLTRLPDIGDVVVRLIGMSAEQFFQVVLLPQGEFAKFLRASSEDRERLLERLFDTERFGDLEEWLRDCSRASEATVTERVTALDRIAGQIVALGGVDAPPAAPDLDWAQECLDAARSVCDSEQAALDAARAAVHVAQAAHDAGVQRAEHRRRGRQATERLDQLRLGEADRSKVASALDAARRAAPIASLIDEHEHACSAYDAATRAWESARAAMAAVAGGEAVCDANEAELRVAVDGWTAESGRWEPLAARVAERPALVSDIETLKRDVGAAQTRRAELAGLLAAAPGRRDQVQAALTTALEARGRIPQLESEREHAERIARALLARTQVDQSLRQSDTAVLEAREIHVAAREHLLDLRTRRLAGMAAELAAELVDGEPCVVCGSQEHPQPARAGDASPVGDAQESSAANAEQRAAKTRARAESDRAALVERRKSLDETVGDADATDTEHRLQRIGEQLADARRCAEGVPALQVAVENAAAESDAHRAEAADLDSAQSARNERLSALRTRLAELDAEVLEATGGRVGVTERRRELADLCRLAGQLRDALRERESARVRRDEIAARLRDRCVDAGFEDPAGVRAALAPAQQIQKWESTLQQAITLRSAALETLGDPDVTSALEGDPVDTGALAASLALARGAADKAASSHAVAARRAADLERYVAEFWAASDALAPLQAKCAELSGLAELVSGHGQNARRMSLHSYVLAARLEEVLVAASARLHQMSSGRYEFVHTDAVGPRGRRGGLGIEVRDEYTGAVRATTTLSGGETFFASLALALGLADVVSAESGGRVLDTIFIDEGFGTLDPEALDLVMGVLDDLRSGGRVVGVVSHVDELRARIPAQLQVVRGDSGSTVRMSELLRVS